MTVPGQDHLTQRDFHRLSELIEGYCGIKMPFRKRIMLEGRLRRRVRARGLDNLAGYCRYLFEEGGLREEGVHLIDAVTTNKTDFFREPEHFRFLMQRALPELTGNRLVTFRSPLKFWSAACSTGAEPYTLAMLLDGYRQNDRGMHYSILATDISTDVLRTAKLGIYPENMAIPIPMDLRKLYLLRSKRGPFVRIVPELRRSVRFERLNLMEAPYNVDSNMDIVFCRNILIYFDKETQLRVLLELCRNLRSGGYLFLGHSETLIGFEAPLVPVATSIFRRI
jgi:chemotaxis protein methyltransferase CheR